MAINPLLLLSGIGIMVLAAASMLYWRRRTGADMKFFMAGAGIWIVAVAVKLLLDLTVTVPLQQWAFSAAGLGGALAAVSVYVGVRTGLLESGLSYFAILKTWLKRMKPKEAVAFGIGFGAFEAFIVGASSFLNVLIFVLMPEVIATVPVEYQAIIIEQLSASTLFVIPAIIERAAAILLHVFSAVLVVYAVRTRKLKYLWYSVIYKAIVDGIIPGLVYALNPASSLAGAYVIEIPFIMLGAIGFYGTKWLARKKW